MENFIVFKTAENDWGKRADKALRFMLKGLPLSLIFSSIRKGRILINEKKFTLGYKLKENDTFYVHPDLVKDTTSEIKTSDTTDSKINEVKDMIIFQNANIIAVNKPCGMLVHGDDSLDEIMQVYLKNKIPASLSFKPGPINRLDRNTSGLMFFSKSYKGAAELSSIFQNSLIQKYYLAVLDGQLEAMLQLEDALYRDKTERKTYIDEPGMEINAETNVVPILSGDGINLCLIKIATGKTHQIRIQCSNAGYPLSGDSKYGGSRILKNYILHSFAVKLKKESEVCGFNFLKAELGYKERSQLNRLFGKDELSEALEKVIKKIKTSL